ncbi:hypothetical protein E4T66_17450 [Sinimarinibacterium sp. CAU 1509]|uniref:hypothetical protein n=1 Tax=Sinimarinibacterium sp. CAU 1509 TaxID=2562283 RepID=UPI0010ABD284|nr:hypothetical protein [Sinimarinibacterium sp. CAU 1509]TJY57195.1 hypothetical protein E4T66_17450 [Sinimarinibacterium sp. CAU 1509]
MDTTPAVAFDSSEFATPSGAAPLPKLVQHFIDAWPRYLAAIHAAQRTVEDLKRDAESIGQDAARGWAWDPMQSHTLDMLVAAAFAQVTDHARTVFCEGSYDVLSHENAHSVMRQCGASDDPQAPDFAGYWRALEARLGAGEGTRRALALCAARIRKHWNIFASGSPRADRWGCAPKIERDCVTFETGYPGLSRCIGGKGFELRGYEIHKISAPIDDLGRVLGTAFPAAKLCAELDALPTGHALKLPLRLISGRCQWTFQTSTTRLRLPMDLALQLRQRLDELDPEEPA